MCIQGCVGVVFVVKNKILDTRERRNMKTKPKAPVPEKPINVTIANVISWYEESECCIFHNHAQRIPVTKVNDTDVVQSIIDNYYS
jgi:hypothetical protein